MNTGEFRREYQKGALSEETLDPDPIRQFERWFQDACEASVIEPNAMSLATATADGRPSVRTVLMKTFDPQGFVFFTNYRSQKAQQIGENPRACLLFPWLALERQVIVSGDVSRVSTAESLTYFTSRPRGSQLGAWVSPQSSIITTRGLLEAKLEEIKRKFGDGKIPLPDFWGGFRVRPKTIEFWQGRKNRLHDRFLYTRQDDETWTIDRLAP